MAGFQVLELAQAYALLSTASVPVSTGSNSAVVPVQGKARGHQVGMCLELESRGCNGRWLRRDLWVRLLADSWIDAVVERVSASPMAAEAGSVLAALSSS